MNRTHHSYTIEGSALNPEDESAQSCVFYEALESDSKNRVFLKNFAIALNCPYIMSCLNHQNQSR